MDVTIHAWSNDKAEALQIEREMIAARIPWLQTHMNGAQCRAARGLLNMKQPALAKAAGVSISTVVDFEQSRRKVSDELVRAMQVALEAAGVLRLPF